LTYVSSHVTILLKGTLFFPFGGFLTRSPKKKKKKFEKNLALVSVFIFFPFEVATGVAKKESAARRAHRQERRRRQEKASPR